MHRSPVRTRVGHWLLVLSVFGLLAAACSDDDDVAGDSSSGGDATDTSLADDAEVPDGEPIRFAVVAAVEGVVGQPEIFEAADATVAAVNAAGGIVDPAGGPNRPLEVVRCEAGAGGSNDPDAALNCARDTIDDGVVAVVGKYLVGADGTAAWADAEIPLIGTVPIEAEDFINPIVYPLTGGAAVAAGGVGAGLQTEGAETIAFVTGDIEAGRALPTFMTPVLENGEADLVEQVFVSLDPSADYTPQISQLAGSGADAVAVVASTDINARVIRGLRESGYEGLIGVPGTSISPTSVEDLGDLAEGLVIAGGFDAVTGNGEAISEFNRVMDEYAADISKTEFAVNAWASVNLLAEVLGEIDTIDGPTVLAALDGREVDLGVAPPFSFGEPANPFGLPRVFRATTQIQEVVDGEIVATEAGFLDLNELAGE